MGNKTAAKKSGAAAKAPKEQIVDPTAAAPGDKTPGGQDVATATGPDNAPTPTQITEREHGPNVEGVAPPDPKVARHDFPPGTKPAAVEKTTVTEEVRILPKESISKDLSDQIEKMRVLAHTQGLNQSIELGEKKNDDGVKCKEMLIVYQDGSHTTDLVPISTAVE